MYIARGFDSTSLSIWLGIQPAPLLHDLQYFLEDNGFIDRFLFVSCKPFFTEPDVNDQFHILLQQEKIQHFLEVMQFIEECHKDGVQYRLSTEANDEFKTICSEFFNYQASKYCSDSDSTDSEIDSSQVSSVSSRCSKEPFHILKLACLLHVLFTVSIGFIDGIEKVPSKEISLSTLKGAVSFYRTSTKHRYHFLESVSNLSKTTNVKLKSVTPIQHLVLKAIVKTKGPACPVRDIGKHMRGLNANEIKHELKLLQTEGFGILYNNKITVFLKPHPSTFNDKSKPFCHIVFGTMNHNYYNANFMQMNTLSDRVIDICQQHHPHAELMMNLLLQVTDSDDDGF